MNINELLRSKDRKSITIAMNLLGCNNYSFESYNWGFVIHTNNTGENFLFLPNLITLIKSTKDEWLLNKRTESLIKGDISVHNIGIINLGVTLGQLSLYVYY